MLQYGRIWQWGAAVGLLLALALPAGADPPAGYKEANIGAPDEKGKVTVDANGVWTVFGAGNQFDGQTEDQLYFIYKTVRGDGSARARLMRESEGGQQYIGTMIRVSLDANSLFAGLIHSTSALNWINRTVVDEAAVRQSGVSPENYPKRMMVQRVGNFVTGFTSDDGKIWYRIAGPLELPLGDTAEIGLAVSSRDPATLTTTTLQEVEVLEGVVSVSGVQSAASDKAALIVWSPAKNAVGYNVYRGAAGSRTLDKFKKLNADPQAEASYLDASVADGPPASMAYAVSTVYKIGDAVVEGPITVVR